MISAQGKQLLPSTLVLQEKYGVKIGEFVP